MVQSHTTSFFPQFFLLLKSLLLIKENKGRMLAQSLYVFKTMNVVLHIFLHPAKYYSWTAQQK